MTDNTMIHLFYTIKTNIDNTRLFQKETDNLEIIIKMV